MDDREEWLERVKHIRTDSATWTLFKEITICFNHGLQLTSEPPASLYDDIIVYIT